MTDAETLLVAHAEVLAEHIERGILPSRDDVRDIAALLRALLASLATLRGERDALLAEKARLNYLADLAFRSPQARLIAAGGEWSVDNGNNRLGTGASCNDAIDAARAPQGRTDDAQPARLGGTAH